eukprot:2707951-Pyramimonas_sp.AAC.1
MEKADKDAIDLIKKHVSMHGWDKCCLNEDILASKKLWPGQHFRIAWATIPVGIGMLSSDSCRHRLL